MCAAGKILSPRADGCGGYPMNEHIRCGRAGWRKRRSVRQQVREMCASSVWQRARDIVRQSIVARCVAMQTYASAGSRLGCYWPVMLSPGPFDGACGDVGDLPTDCSVANGSNKLLIGKDDRGARSRKC